MNARAWMVASVAVSLSVGWGCLPAAGQRIYTPDTPNAKAAPAATAPAPATTPAVAPVPQPPLPAPTTLPPQSEHAAEATAAPSGTPTGQGLDHDPLVAAHDLEVGTFYYNRDDYVGALARFQDAIQHDPESAEAFLRAGNTELKLNALAPARTDWQQTVRLAPGGKWAKQAAGQLKKHPTV